MDAQHAATAAVDVPDAPAIPGLVFRRFAGPSDYESMVDVMNAAYRADHIDEVATVGQLAANMEHASHFDAARDVLVARIGDRIVAHSIASWSDQSDGLWRYDSRGYVTPEFRRRGIGRAMLRWNERHLREVVAPGHGSAGSRTYSAWAREGEAGAHALLRAEGYEPERFFFDMVRPTLEDLPDAPLPESIEIRPIPEDTRRDTVIRMVLAAQNEAFRDHWGHRESTQEDWDAFLATPETDPSLWVVAWDRDEVAGAAVNTIWKEDNEAFHRSRFWVEDLSVRRPWRRRGLARALLVESLRLLHGRGMTSAALGVDAANLTGALGLYESVGFEVAERSVVYRKPME